MNDVPSHGAGPTPAPFQLEPEPTVPLARYEALERQVAYLFNVVTRMRETSDRDHLARVNGDRESLTVTLARDAMRREEIEGLERRLSRLEASAIVNKTKAREHAAAEASNDYSKFDDSVLGL
jgi:hypothetical protein